MNSLPKHILEALKENKTSLGEHPSYPPEEEEKFIVNLVTNTFNALSEKVGDKDYDTIFCTLPIFVQVLVSLYHNLYHQPFQIMH